MAVGDRLMAGQAIGKVGKAGLVHFNMMNDGEWLEAHGVPALFSDFERVLPGADPRRIDKGNPRTGWLVAPVEGKPTSQTKRPSLQLVGASRSSSSNQLRITFNSRGAVSGGVRIIKNRWPSRFTS